MKVQGIRGAIPFTALTLLLSAPACGSAVGDRVEVRTGLGAMDCPSDLWSYSTAEISLTAEGSESADEALALLTPELGRPAGDPEVEFETPDRVVYLFGDAEGSRLGRVVVIRMPNGWFMVTTEGCAP